MIHLKLRVRGKTYNLIAMNRNLNIEALRVIAMLSILLLHISGRLFVSEDNMIHAAELAVRPYFFIGVSAFAFISGYYGVK